jgi:O-acetyl-ADP-ribose deacetylase (regulator of RNase III)
MKEIEGDLIELAKAGEFDIIAHGLNCQVTMGKGIALTIRKEWPEVYEADKLTEKGDASKLGKAIPVQVQPGLHVFNMYTQYHYSPRGVRHVEYGAIRAGLMCIRESIVHTRSRSLSDYDPRIGLPLIGAGLAGGEWPVIKKIIEEVLPEELFDVTIVHYKPTT